MKLHNVFRKLAFGLAATLSISIMGMSASAYVVENPAAISTSILEYNSTLSPDVIAQEEVNKLFDSFNTMLEQTTKEKQTTLSEIPNIYSSIEYPASYAGVYNDHGIPTLMQVTQNNTLFPSTSSALGAYIESPLATHARSNGFNIKEAKFSLNELNEMMDLFSYYIGKGYDIITVGKSIRTNRVVLGIYQISDEKIQRIKDEILDSEIIDFENEEVNDYKDQLTIYPTNNVSKLVSSYTNPNGQIVNTYANGSFGYAAQRDLNGKLYNGFIILLRMTNTGRICYN